MIAEGHRVTAFAPEDDHDVRRTLAREGCNFEVIEMARTGTNPLADVALLIRMLKAFRRLRPDVVICYTMKPVIYGGIAARWLGIPERHALMTGLGHVFADPEPQGKVRILRRLSIWLYRQALKGVDRIFVYNAADEADLRDFRMVPPETPLIRVAGTGVNLDRFKQSRLPEGTPSFLLIARLLADKGVREYVDAARQLKADWPQARFRIVGPLDPNPTGIQAEEVADWKRSGVVEYCGATDDVRPFLDEASVFVLPSYYREGIPRSILEAMSKGRPVVTTNLPGCADTIEHGVSGYLVPPRDTQALADGMKHFLECPQSISTMGAHARVRAEQIFDIHAVNAHLLSEMGLSRRPSTRASCITKVA
ncbi:N, N'-diacetylbacillosaminyl-diphospho-undecaprenol alpha-1,3-N-acetylgalactosaminyltransferase [Palleronia abyssalis]|uniref:N, N'-diacetylbacillosaminyl-diphospho-undecaprenol alpha-1,3-N-acetylgalactosaminyltransferase n=2 Tax=Palleronia abyssalis TaxID=1501240 RepID=A0A2R8BYJ1_9RHOB|nr:N, N'-diacetylbacillosaminyl-diphospho-undecaprenol alpha-1,3-N-acetylgalactosaminyltransferase [Palleronia abyssalis]